ncbi:MAG: acetate uptake transporter [Candidatus Melainabacteria bacterium]|nr:acetate uptake transporter [Candidatus Melainabacteria bacterium]
MDKKDGLLKIDVLSIGLFGLAVGALTLGLVQMGIIPHNDDLAISIICLIFAGIVQVVAGIVDIRYHDQLGGTALTMYGFYWTSIFTVKILGLVEGFRWDNVLFIPIVAIYAIFSAVMIYLTGHKSLVLMLLHIFITAVFTIDIFVKLNYPLEYYAGIDHVIIGSIALYHAMVTLVNKYTGKVGYLLGRPLFKF